MDSDDPTVVRKLQKAGREKRRRCRLNEQFIELGTTLDAERPKNDKATMLTDTIQLLKDLTAEVDKLKAEHTALSDESRELTQEKNDLREEKTALKSDIDRLSGQCQQRAASAYPWVAMDSVLQHPPSYPYPMPMPVPSGAVPMHLSMQPYPFFGNPNPGMYANPCSTFVPYMPPNLPAEQPSTQDVSPPIQPGRGTQVSARQGVGTSSDKHGRQANKNDDSNDVPTNLELKTPGSTTDENTSSGNRKRRIAAEGSSLSRYSSHSVQDSSSSSIVGGGKDLSLPNTIAHWRISTLSHLIHDLLVHFWRLIMSLQSIIKVITQVMYSLHALVCKINRQVSKFVTSIQCMIAGYRWANFV